MADTVENTDTNTIIQTQLDMTDTILVIPSTKLDADQYAAEDIDGVTESLFGSGNMAYGVLQASQTDEALIGDNPFAYSGNEGLDISNTNPGGNITTNAASDFADLAQTGLSAPGFSHGNIIASTENAGIDNTGRGDGNFASSTVGSLSASQLSSDAGAFAPAGSGLSFNSGLDGISGLSGLDGTDSQPQNGPPGNNGANGQDGTNGQDDDGDGNGDGGDTIIDIDLGDTIVNLGDIDIDLGDITDIIDGLFIDLGDTITTLSTEITNITNVLGDVLNDLDILNLDNVTTLLTNITNNLTDIVNNTVTEISNITNNITDIVNNVLGDGLNLDDLHLTLDLNVLDTVLTGVDIPLDNILDTDINLDVDLNSTYDFVNNIADLTGIDVLSDTLGELGGTVDTLQNTIDQFTDVVSDLDLNNPGASVNQLLDTLTNLNDTVGDITNNIDDSVGDILDNIGLGGDDPAGDGLISQTLDPVVNDLGNVLDDVTGGATGDLTDTLDDTVDGITDLADNLTGGLTDSLLGENNTNQDGNGDTDIVADLGIDPLGLDETIEAALDPVEDLVGDIDLGLGLGTDLLGGNGNEIDNNAGDTDITVNTGIDLVDNTVLAEGLDIPLDPVEAITGDIDIDINLATDLLGNLADPLLNDGEGGTGEDTILAGAGDELGDTVGGVLDGNLDTPLDDLIGGDNPAGDGLISDIIDPVVNDIGDTLDDVTGGATGDLTDTLDDTVDGVTDLADNLTGGLTDSLSDGLTDGLTDGLAGGLLGDQNNGDTDTLQNGEDIAEMTEEIIPDLIEEITGDNDLGIGDAINLLAGNNTEDSAGNSGGDENSWTESTIGEGGLFDDLVGGLGGEADILPDPAGTVAEGLGVLDINPDLDVGSLGGLFG